MGTIGCLGGKQILFMLVVVDALVLRESIAIVTVQMSEPAVVGPIGIFIAIRFKVKLFLYVIYYIIYYNVSFTHLA